MKFFKVEEAASIIGIGKNALYERIRQERFPHERYGQRIVIPERAMDIWTTCDALENAGWTVEPVIRETPDHSETVFRLVKEEAS